MDFSLSEEQQLLKDSITQFVDKDYQFDIRQKNVSSDLGYSSEFWKTFADEEYEELEEKFRVYVGNIVCKYKKERYLSKNNQNIKRVELIIARVESGSSFKKWTRILFIFMAIIGCLFI